MCACAGVDVRLCVHVWGVHGRDGHDPGQLVHRGSVLVVFNHRGLLCIRSMVSLVSAAEYETRKLALLVAGWLHQCMVWWVRFWENSGEEGRLPDATASGSRARLSSPTL